MARLRLGELLLQAGKIDANQLKSALARHRQWGRRLGECIVQLGFMKEVEICEVLSQSLRLPMIDVSQIDASKITRQLLDYIPVHQARQHRTVPLAVREVRKRKRLIVATSDPTNFRFFDDLQFKTGLPCFTMIAPDSDIDWFIRKHYMGETDSLPQTYVTGSLNQCLEPNEEPRELIAMYFDSGRIQQVEFPEAARISSKKPIPQKKKS